MMRRLPKAPAGYSVYEPPNKGTSMMFIIGRNADPSGHHSIVCGVSRRNGAIRAVSLFRKYTEKPKNISVAQFVFMLCARDRIGWGK